MSIDFGNDIYEEPIVAKTFLQEDENEYSLRPRTLREYIGQEKAKGNLEVFIQAAKMRHEPMDHVLLHGPPGLGKTTLAGIIAQEMGAGIRITSGPAIEKPGDLAALLTNLNEGDILFVDEIHRLNRSVEEIRQIIGADSLAYLELDRLKDMVDGLPCCSGCFTGKYPLDPPKEDIRGDYER